MEELQMILKEVLPDLGQDLLTVVTEHLKDEIGVNSPEDFKYIQESDVPMLKPIQRRKLLAILKKETGDDKTSADTNQSVIQTASTPAPHISSAPTQEEYLKSNVNPTWAEEYEVPWNKLQQKDLLDALKSGLRPKPSARREMIRIICSDISSITQKPTKRALSYIAQRIVQTYPNSFRDMIEGTQVGTGYDSLLKQFITRFENMNRNSNTTLLKSKDSGNTRNQEVTKKRKAQDTYGCVNYMPANYPDGENEATLIEKKILLKEQYKHDISKNVQQLLEATYMLQRKDILENELKIKDLMNEWPFMFQPNGMFSHFKILTGIEIKQKIENTMMKNSEHILQWMSGTNDKKIREIYEGLVEAKAVLNNRTPEIPAIISSVITHFKENEASVFQIVETPRADSDLERHLLKTPCLVAVGTSLMMAERFMVSVDGVIINNNINDFIVALAMLFSAYYIFNIEYPSDAEATLEFIQRCMVGINPERGHKAENKKNRTHHTPVHPKVLALINKLADSQWIP